LICLVSNLLCDKIPICFVEKCAMCCLVIGYYTPYEKLIRGRLAQLIIAV
jgi:hypothetical protein